MPAFHQKTIRQFLRDGQNERQNIMAETKLADVGAAQAALAKATAGLAAGAGQLAPQEPQSLDQIPEFRNASDGSKIGDEKRFTGLLTQWREAATILGNILRDEKAAGRAAADAIAALRRTIVFPNGKPDYFGDSLIWKSYMAPMLKRELEDPSVFGINLGRDIWNRAVNYYHARDLTIDATIVDDAIADGRITPEDAQVYTQLMEANGTLGEIKRKAVEKLPESVVDLVNNEIAASAQPRDSWKLEKVERKTRLERLAADPDKAIKDAVDSLTAIARVGKAGDGGPSYTPLRSWETYYRGQSSLIHDMLVAPDGKPRKGGIRDLPKVVGEMSAIRDMLDNAIRFFSKDVPDAAKPDMETVLATLFETTNDK